MRLCASASHLLGIVRRVVENLHVQEIGRVVEVGGGFDETLDHVAFIEDRQLYCDEGPLGDSRRSRGNVFGVHEVVVDQPVAMQAVNREDKEDNEIRNHHREIEGVGMVDAYKSFTIG